MTSKVPPSLIHRQIGFSPRELRAIGMGLQDSTPNGENDTLEHRRHRHQHERWQGFRPENPILAAHTQPGIPDPQLWKSSRVQRRRHASSSRRQLLHAASKQPRLHVAKTADPSSLLCPTAAPPSLETARRRAGSRSQPALHTASSPVRGPTPPPRRLREASTEPAPSAVAPRAQASWPLDPAGAYAYTMPPAAATRTPRQAAAPVVPRRRPAFTSLATNNAGRCPHRVARA
jgi:hypothetical protein